MTTDQFVWFMLGYWYCALIVRLTIWNLEQKNKSKETHENDTLPHAG